MFYSGRNLKEIIFPMGGIGTGSIGLAGNGSLRDFEIFNRPDKGSLNGYTHIAVRAVKDGKCVARVLNGDDLSCRTGQYGKSFGYGIPSDTMAGFPHFADTDFRGELPYAFLSFREGGFPAGLRLKAFSPFIPLDDFDSSLPAAMFAVEVTNTEASRVRYAVAFTVKNPYKDHGVNVPVELFDSGSKTCFAKGVGLHSTLDGADPAYGDMTLAVDDPSAQVQAAWYRGGWKDSITSFWNEFSSGEALRERHYSDEGNDHATVMSEFELDAGESRRVRFALTWYNPNCVNYWKPYRDENGRDIGWKNWYATQFEDSVSVADYVLWNWDTLDSRTRAFHDALHGSTLDPAVIDAVASTLTVLRSPTVMRLEDGSFYGFEGVSEHTGSCEGTCQHVWNYAYALPFLFPGLERSIRDNEFKYSTDDNGHMEFRLKLPPGRPFEPFRACVDGQMGAVIKTWREWKISGNTEWLKSVYPKMISALEYAFSPANADKWDADMDGVLEGRQHHTLDMELFGPSSWLEGFYLAALKCGALMARELGDASRAEKYEALYEKGRAYANSELFNGEYFCQKVDIEDLETARRFGAENYINEETGELKYQIGEGSAIDQLCAQWHADILGLGRLFDSEKTRTSLESMLRYNYMPSMRTFANPWRLFSVYDEAGTVICAYPKGRRKPKIPVPYCEETMCGFEYQFAGLLMAEGLYDEGVMAAKAVRDRHDGSYRNPYNEIECGSNYARSMAAFAMLPISAGLRFDLPHGLVGFDPLVKGDFRCLWSLGTGWGTLRRTSEYSAVELIEGSLSLCRLYVPDADRVTRLTIDGEETPFELKEGELCFEQRSVTRCVKVEYRAAE